MPSVHIAMRPNHLLAAAAAALLPCLASAQIANAPCFESNLGTNLGAGDDTVSQGLALGFTFPGPAGPVTSIDVSSNGFLWLGSNTNPDCCDGDVTLFLSDLPRIAPLWMDLYPPSGAGVFFNTFAATPNAPARAVVTWSQVPEFGTNSPPFTFQVQLLSTGEVVFYYDANVGNQLHNVLTGITDGNAHAGGTAVNNPIDFSALTSNSPHNSGSNPTVLELQSLAFDIAARTFEFIPNGSGGYLVFDRVHCAPAGFRQFGVGCPRPTTVYELFDASRPIDLSGSAILFTPNGSGGYTLTPTTGFFTGFTNAIASGDDVLTGPLSLPFPFAFPGGSTNAIDVDSNGSVVLVAGALPASRCCDGDPVQFVADPASIAALWQDLDQTSGGNIYFDVVGTTDAHITWSQVPEYATNSPNTFQVSLFNNGSFRLSWQSVATTNHTCLVGFTPGNGAFDPGTVDLSASLPIFAGGTRPPLTLGAQAGSRPVIGSTFTMELGNVPASSVFGVLALGFNQQLPGFDLTLLGMPGCARWISLDADFFFPLTGSPAPVSLHIPTNNVFAGYTIYCQGATLSPGANALGVLVSNGGTIAMGR